MAAGRSITMRHLVFTVLVVILINAQLTWWIVFVLRQNRTLLELERSLMADACRNEAARVQQDLHAAEQTLAQWTASQEGYGSSGIWAFPPPTPPEPFARWVEPAEIANTTGWHQIGDGRLLYAYPGENRLNVLITNDGWESDLLDIGEGLDLRTADGGEIADPRPSVPLPAPFAGLVISPAQDAWDDALDGYRRRILMMVSEGTFFAVMLLVLMGLLWRTFRREVELERQHRNFLSAITHELKSPLASSHLALETVLSGRADETTSRRFLHNALNDTVRLQDLVQKVLETTRYGHGGRLDLRRVCLSEVVASAISAIRPRLEAAGGEVHADVTPDVQVGADEEAFRILISNLLENAVKYGGTPPHIDVALRLERDWAVLEVSDNGSGIASEEVPLVFQRFYRSGDELSRTTHGTGLGLYLVRQIARIHRGTVKITSTGPDGTTFRVEVPGADIKECGP